MSVDSGASSFFYPQSSLSSGKDNQNSYDNESGNNSEFVNSAFLSENPTTLFCNPCDGMSNNNMFHNNVLLEGNHSCTGAIMTTNDIHMKNAGGDSMQNKKYWMTMAPSPALPDYPFPAESYPPMPAAYLTPDHGPIPRLALPDSPMFLESPPFQPPTDASVVSQASIDDDNNRYTPIVRHGGRFLRGSIGTVGSALSTVASYVNQGLLLGIPFHFADRAMKESKQLYSKWWDQEVGKKRKVEADTEAGEMTTGHPVGKKRRLDSCAAVSRSGSILTKSLTKNYDNELMETCNIGHNKTIASLRSPKSVVDCSIIKPRRGPQKSSMPNLEEPSMIGQVKADNSYNSFNRIDLGGMYDLGEMKDSVNTQTKTPYISTNDSIGTFHLVNGYDAFNDIGRDV
jgi:hypothetical protein